MKNKCLFFVAMALMCLNLAIQGQEKYAILISGDRPDSGDPWVTEELAKLWYASWNDTYLMWEMLVYEKGYDNDNVFVLWADGTDWSITSNVAQEYDPQESHNEDFPGQF